MSNLVQFKDGEEFESFTDHVFIRVVDNGFLVEYNDEEGVIYKTCVYSYENPKRMFNDLAEELGIKDKL